MTFTASPEAAMCLHLVSSLCLSFTLPAERATALAVLDQHRAALDAMNRQDLAVAVRRMIAAQTPYEWTSACDDATRALVPIHKAEAMKLMAARERKGAA